MMEDYIVRDGKSRHVAENLLLLEIQRKLKAGDRSVGARDAISQLKVSPIEYTDCSSS
jgi:hypothetical protein